MYMFEFERNESNVQLIYIHTLFRCRRVVFAVKVGFTDGRPFRGSPPHFTAFNGVNPLFADDRVSGELVSTCSRTSRNTAVPGHWFFVSLI